MKSIKSLKITEIRLTFQNTCAIVKVFTKRHFRKKYNRVSRINAALREKDKNMSSNSVVTIQSIVEKERSHFGVAHEVLTAGNLVAWKATWDTFITALDAIIIGVIRNETVKVYDTQLSGALPASNFARRESKLLIRYIGDTTGKKFTLEVPTPDFAALTAETGDANFINLADGGVMAAWVTAAEVIMRSPDDATETVTIDSAQAVGRNI